MDNHKQITLSNDAQQSLVFYAEDIRRVLPRVLHSSLL